MSVPSERDEDPAAPRGPEGTKRSRGARRSRQILAAAWLVLASAAPFARGLGFEHVYDDHSTVEATPAFALSFGELLGALARGDTSIPDVSRPAMVVSAYLDHTLWGSGPFGPHLSSLLLYVACTFAAAALAFALVRRRDLAVGAAGLWAAMPVHAETVVSPSYREDLFAALGVFAVLALLFWPHRAPGSWREASAVGALAAVGLAGKESALVLVPLVAVLATMPHARLDDALAWAARREKAFVVLGLVVLSYLAWRAGLAIHGDGVARAAEGSRGAHDDARYVIWAASSSLAPFRVMPLHPVLAPASAALWVPIALVLAVMVRARRTWLLGPLALLFLGALGSTPALRPVNEHADRYLLVTTLGAACLAVIGLDVAARRLAPRRVRAGVPIAALTLLLGVTAAATCGVWATDLTLFTHATEQVPTSAKAWRARGWAERRAGLLDEASESLARSLALEPDRADARLSLAYVALERGEIVEARAALTRLRDEGHGELPGFPRAWRCAFDVPRTEAAACVRQEGR
ncbi:MAG: tetratricopeptide repeat protein [Sandaracinus sp.]